MKIWVIMTGERDLEFGGRIHRAGLVASMLRDKGHHVTWWTSSFDHQDKKYVCRRTLQRATESGIQMIYLHTNVSYSSNISVRRLINHRLIAREFTRVAAREVRPDAIFCAYPTIELADAAVRYGKRVGTRVIVDVRDLWPDAFVSAVAARGALLRAVARAALEHYFRRSRNIFRKADSIIAISEGYLQWALHRGDRARATQHAVFPLGLKITNTMTHRSNARQLIKRKGIDPSKQIVWFLGTFGHTYDLGTVIKAAKECLERHVGIQFILSGSGPLENQWRAQAVELPNVHFTGWLTQREINAVSEIAYIGLLSYAAGAPQGLPNKLFEYLAGGIPVVSSLTTEAKILIEKHDVGLSYAPGSSKDLLYALLLLCNDAALRKRQSLNASRLFHSQFNADVIYDKLASHIIELANAP